MSGEAVHPVMPVAGQQTDCIRGIVDGDDEPIAIKLDLREPVLTLGRLLRDRAELRLLSLGEGRPKRQGPVLFPAGGSRFWPGTGSGIISSAVASTPSR